MKIDIYEDDLSFIDPDVFNLWFASPNSNDAIVTITISDDILRDFAKSIMQHKASESIAAYRVIENTYDIECQFSNNLYGTTPETGNDAFVGEDWDLNNFATKLMFDGSSIWVRIDPMDSSYICYAEADITEALRENEEIGKALQ